MSSLWSNIFRRKQEPSEAYTLLHQIPLFEHLDRRECQLIEHLLYRREYPCEGVIFRQGDPGIGMYIIARGTVLITYEPGNRVLSELQAGDFFGEIALLNETPRSATARAKTPCTLYGFFRPDLLELLERDPDIGVRVLLPLAQITGQRLIHADEEHQRLLEALEHTTRAQENVSG
jgi:CRP-like cAMP-binding protein